MARGKSVQHLGAFRYDNPSKLNIRSDFAIDFDKTGTV